MEGPLAQAVQEEWAAIITTFMRRHVEAAGASGVVLGLSGGLDSAVVAALAVRALGKENVHGLIMPAPDSDPRDSQHAVAVAKWLGIEVAERPLKAFMAGFAGQAWTEAALQNSRARLRMILLYGEAQSRGLLVCGTGNKSELLVGYFTKHGDGGNDLQPIGDLYKTQVRQLATWLGVPDDVTNKPPSAGLRPGQTDEDDLGLTYTDLDRILAGMERNHSVEEIAKHEKLPLAMVTRVDDMVRSTEHKRRLALAPKIGIRTVGLDWRRPVH